jgi:predicted regulator of Ras-like GTPase activity (Roadblock/LC7/MglB family)
LGEQLLTDLKKVLENFSRLDNVRGAALVDDHGLMIEEFFRQDEDSSTLAVMVMRAAQAAHALVGELGKAPLTQQYIEFADLQVTAEQLLNNYMLVILADSGANLGRVRLEVRKNKSAVEALLV